MRSGTIFSGLLLLGFFNAGFSQDLTVKVLDQSTSKPISDALVRLHYGCWHSMRPIELKQKTDAAGNAIFHSVTLTPLEFCVLPDYDFASREQTVLFTSPQTLANIAPKYSGQVVYSLPSTITFHVRRLRFSERLRQIFSYD